MHSQDENSSFWSDEGKKASDLLCSEESLTEQQIEKCVVDIIKLGDSGAAVVAWKYSKKISKEQKKRLKEFAMNDLHIVNVKK